MKRVESPRLIIFTDLDGTLLDLTSYSFRPAIEALTRVKETATPLIFCSSKTAAEQLYYHKEMGIRAPFIVENGSAIFIPQDYFTIAYPAQRTTFAYRVIEMGVSAAVINQRLQSMRDDLKLQFQMYTELSINALCRLTGLDRQAASRARLRDYSETIVGLSRPEAETLHQALAPAGLSCTWGGRFCTVTAAQIDKGQAVNRLTDLFQKQYGAVITVGIGDSANDASFLAAVDEAFLVQQPDQRWEPISTGYCKPVEGVGPIGWNRVVSNLLNIYYYF
ncbi:MAG: HAD-IIB family hydrolase [Acidobacteriota bacterium]